jgi:prepilin-type N-terminal cleavage/methylation domain-containing protein
MRKHGFTLVEMIVVMAAMAVVLGTTTVLLVQLFDFQRNNDEYSYRSRSVDRLVAAFRDDVHANGQPEILTEGKTLLRWKTESETVEYAVEPGDFPDQQAVVRTVQKDGQQNRSETYLLPDRTTVWCVDGKDANVGLVALSLWTTPQRIEMPKMDELNPFDRSLPKNVDDRIDPKYAGNWRTIIARY